MFVRWVKLWIVVSALASVGGWVLSAAGALNIWGYGYCIVALSVLAILYLRQEKYPLLSRLFPARDLGKLRGRLRRFLPASFGILALLVFLSGVLYAPNDHTALSYRLPRVLQWISHDRWFWIHTPNYRMNDRACGIEWLSAPLLLFTKSDRALFLLNFVPFLLMPGLIFSVWTRLGVRPRVAWNWMWLVPTGYCFLLQAGGIANDAFPTVYALAMIDFGLRGLQRSSKLEIGRSVSNPNRLADDAIFSLWSAALMVGAKASNLPLGLPWALAFLPLLPRLWRSFNASRLRLFAVASMAILIALAISFIPTALMNIHYLHNWSGLNIEHAGMDMKNPVAGVLGNAVLLFTNNFVPTFFPMARWWNEHALAHFPATLVRLMDANFEGGYNTLGEMPTEDWAGQGFGVGVLVVISVIAACCRRHATRNTQHAGFYTRLLLIAPWISLLAYCAKTGMVTPARLIAPYYPLLLPLLLIGGGQSQVVRKCWWKVLAGMVVALALVALIVTPARPLWPWKPVLSHALALHPGQSQLLRAQKVYEVYADRADPLAALRESFPPGLKTIGFLGTEDDLDISLWKPYGSRRVEPILLSDPLDQVRALGVEYIVVGGFNLKANGTSIEDWCEKSNAELVATTSATMTVTQGPQPWYLVRLK
jgi:hypothetical protein